MSFGRTFTKSLRSSLILLLMGLSIVTGASSAAGAQTGILTYVETNVNSPGLDSPRSIAVNPTLNRVYVTGFNDDSVSVFRKTDGGGLELVDVQRDGVNSVDGLNGATGVAVSPDGWDIYVASSIDHAVAAFRHFVNSPALIFRESEKDGVGGVDGLYGASAVVVSPDGKHVYVTGYSESAVAIFSRDAATGLLTYVGMVQDGVGGVDGLHGARSIDICADGNHVYVASNIDDAVAVFSRNSTTGALTYVEVEKDGLGGVAGLDGANWVAVRGNKVYVVGKNDHAVVVFSRNDSTGALTYLTEAREGVGAVDGLSDPIAVAVSPDGLHTYATGSADDAVVTMQYMGGTWNWLLYKGKVQDGVGGVDGLDHAYAVTVSPDGNYVYATGEVADAVVILRRNSTTGGLTYVDMVDDVGGLAGPRAVAVSPDGRHVYAVSPIVEGVEGDNAIAVFARNGTTGRLDFIHHLEEGVGGVRGLANARSVVVSPDGRHVYTTSYDDSAVGIFGRDTTTGELTYLGLVQEGVGNPPVDGLTGAKGIAISPDGSYVYATGWVDDALVLFRRTARSGALAWAGTLKRGVSGVDGLSGASGIAVSLDGKNVYVAGSLDNAVAVFEWKKVGALPVLSYVEVERNLVNGVAGLEGATSVAVSPDGAQVYVTGVGDHALAVFTRNWQHGELTYLTARWDDNGGVDGLNTPFSVAVHPVTQEILVAGYGDSALAAFERDRATGHPVYLGMEKDGVGGVWGLEGVYAVASSPDGRHVYAVSTTDQALVVFDRGLSLVHLPVAIRN